MGDTNVNFETEVLVEQRDEHLYVATIMPFHVTGRSNTFEGVIERAREGLDQRLYLISSTVACRKPVDSRRMAVAKTEVQRDGVLRHNRLIALSGVLPLIEVSDSDRPWF